MKLSLSPVTVCRTPVFSIHETTENVWQELKEYIHESSPAFYEMIRDRSFAEYDSLDPKIRFTIWKYFNRARYRATPFGNFAAFSTVPLSREQQTAPVVLAGATTVHRFPNWQEKEQISFEPKYALRHALYVRTNAANYSCGKELRYLTVQHGHFELSAIAAGEAIMATLNFCHEQRTIPELREFLKVTFSLKHAVLNYFIEQLIGTQLILTNFYPNITGTEYFSRIGYHHTPKKNDYIIAERTRISGELPARDLQIIPELVGFLHQYQSPYTNRSLTDFRIKFSQRFDQQKVPLLVALDPEMGIGYRSLTQDKDESLLIQHLKTYREQNRPGNRSISYSPLHQFILDGMLHQGPVRLEDFRDAAHSGAFPLPNTMNVMLHKAKDLLVVEQIGGCTATNLLGRFSMASDEITRLANQFAALEHEANPGVLFFDIAYQIENHADNINRRKAVYPYELPLLSWSESGGIIDPDDILLSVAGDELVLHSVKYKKRIVPRLASAYNYVRSDLPVYRFLSDLQHQNICSELMINTEQMFPGLSHYQRVQYKQVVVSAEKWLVPAEVSTWKELDKGFSVLTQWLKAKSIHQPFKCGIGDQTLIFNPQLQEDLQSFLYFCKNKTDLYIEETFMDDEQPVRDEQHRPYLSEFVVNLEHRERLYKPYPLKTAAPQGIRRSFMPGEDWLYFEIYCHPANSNAILLTIARTYILPVKRKLKNWFFIRYNDPAYHIRLRIKLYSKEDITDLVSGLSDVLAPFFETGIVADLQLKTYHRETERYGQDRMELAEKCFSNSSNLAVYLITKPLPLHQLYHLSVLLLEKVLEAAGFGLQQQLGLVEKVAGLFMTEMNVPSEGLKKINQEYKDFVTETEQINLSIVRHKKIVRASAYFQKVLKACPEQEKEVLLTDLFHMHVNRLFSNDQRMHEMIIYYYLTKKIKTKLARLKQKSV